MEAPVDKVDEFLNAMRPVRLKIRKEPGKGSRCKTETLRRLVGANEAKETQIADLTADVHTAGRKLRPVRKLVVQNDVSSDIARERSSHENDLQLIEHERSTETEKSAVTENAIAVGREDGEALAKEAEMIEGVKRKKPDLKKLARLAK